MDVRTLPRHDRSKWLNKTHLNVLYRKKCEIFVCDEKKIPIIENLTNGAFFIEC